MPPTDVPSFAYPAPAPTPADTAVGANPEPPAATEPAPTKVETVAADTPPDETVPAVRSGQVIRYIYFDPYDDADVERVGLVVDVVDGAARVLWFPNDAAHAIPVGDLEVLG